MLQTRNTFSNEPGIYIEGEVRTLVCYCRLGRGPTYSPSPRLAFVWRIASTSEKTDRRNTSQRTWVARQKALGLPDLHKYSVLPPRGTRKQVV